MHRLTVGVSQAYLNWALFDNNDLLAVDFFDRSYIGVKSISARIGRESSNIGYHRFRACNVDYKRSITRVANGRDNITECCCVRADISKNYVITSQKYLYEDMYNFLMANYEMPLLREWMEPIMRTYSHVFRKSYRSYIGDGAVISIHGEDTPISEVVIYRVQIKEEDFEKIITDSLRSGLIRIINEPQIPLKFDGLDDYFAKYGKTIIDNIEENTKPIEPVNGRLDIAMKTKRPFAQQAACASGISALLEKQDFGFLVMGMGTGKTLTSMAITENYYYRKWRKRNPDKDMKEFYLDPSAANYRAIVMCPSHLVDKWASELNGELYKAEVKTIKRFEDLIAIRESGKNAKGREWFVISKDFAKLGDFKAPSVSQKKCKTPVIKICEDCYKDGYVNHYTKYGQSCSRCGGTRVKKYVDSGCQEQIGFICPHCNELLVSISAIEGVVTPIALTDVDFANKTSSNRVCYHCGEQLWGSEVKNINIGGEFENIANKKPYWHKMTYYANKTHKSKNTAFVTDDMEFLRSKGLDGREFISRDDNIKGPRKYAPAEYILKYLKGYFDFAIFDEAHLYESGSSAQGHAMHALIKSSKKQLALTGTISNGYASNLFYLFWRFMPERMVARGWKYDEVTRFSKLYGTVETQYKLGESGYNSQSRGRQLSSPKQKPGISPLIYTDFLLENCVQLDLSDLSKFLPPLKEEVVTCPLESDIAGAYRSGLDQFKSAVKGQEGMGVMAQMLQFGLFFPDKPYDRVDVKSPFTRDKIVVYMRNLDEYRNKLTNKEQEMLGVLKKELVEKRNVFIFCECTGEGEARVLERVRDIVVDNTHLSSDEVIILEATTTAADKRESWIHKKAEKGARVFICNPRLCETGLDFIWWDAKGVEYNFPTIFFYETGYRLDTLWQASCRHYRLIQKKECRTYYFAYEGTAQTATLELMAKKKVAVSALQGNFSSEGLSAMAVGVDARVVLASKMASGNIGNDDVTAIKDAFKGKEKVIVEDIYDTFEKGAILSEILGFEDMQSQDVMISNWEDPFEIVTDDEKPVVVEEVIESDFGFDLGFDTGFDLGFSGFDFDFGFDGLSLNNVVTVDTTDEQPKKKRKAKKKNDYGISFFDFAM